MKADEIARLADELGGCEIHRDDWAEAEKLTSRGYRLGPPRGPSRNFRRIHPPSGPDEE